MVQAVDEGVGQIMDTLERLGIAENTVVIFTSDNGPTTCGQAGPLKGGKNRQWEGGIRVPTVMWWPGTIEAGRVSEERMILMDALPSALAINGIDPGPLRFDGVDFSSHLREGSPLGERKIYFEYHRIWKDDDHRYVIIDENNWKWAYNLQSPDLNGHGLFDLNNDLGEENNLASQHPELVAQRMKELRAWLDTVGGEDYNKRK
jgi:arylsulfatase A-like enzyme